MITLYKMNGVVNSNNMELVGLSTDLKPIGYFQGHIINNGSTFNEIDTGALYFYDMSAKQWHLFNSSGR